MVLLPSGSSIWNSMVSSDFGRLRDRARIARLNSLLEINASPDSSISRKSCICREIEGRIEKREGVVITSEIGEGLRSEHAQSQACSS